MGLVWWDQLTEGSICGKFNFWRAQFLVCSIGGEFNFWWVEFCGFSLVHSFKLVQLGEFNFVGSNRWMHLFRFSMVGFICGRLNFWQVQFLIGSIIGGFALCRVEYLVGSIYGPLNL